MKANFVVIFLMGAKVVGFIYKACGQTKVRKELLTQGPVM